MGSHPHLGLLSLKKLTQCRIESAEEEMWNEVGEEEDEEGRGGGGKSEEGDP